ncbi:MULTISPECIES: DUF2177 family protein [Variovorax]|jgi:uncharacterized membrane protein|uniref:DUF2177 family protein n=1 Tax=Variovorax TaxID=34072 RepID=UPI000869A005|nr:MULTISPECIES: DUF2177 family protein [Variovorax]MBN8754040.1 DUF2177 family protein [Variovorax sp.]ODU15422.1 MAG: hypothetical protein ABS94_18570 [Variovorax sp. SCN 67-85]ODV26626.1 MAG: hypothetical protein ABT25_04975 [Variovorax sp. SCN 67-20]OJZ04621.1 MAG: hypothetical protein BGP22_14395 [Variovorax sp. 67-131]UKI09822.1 DUF2177 family protein [Variovorax paradoxus]
MSTKHLVAWAATFVVLLVIDMIWLGVVAKGMYQEGMGDLMSPNPRLAFAGAFYLIYPIGLLLFAIVPGVEAQSVLRAAVLGALFGMFCYGTYDLTNLAVIRNWPLALSFIDIVWGALVSGVAAAAGAVAWRWMAAH